MADDTEAAQAPNGANGLIVAGREVIEEAGSSQSMSEEEGVSRVAEVSGSVACTSTTRNERIAAADQQ